MIDEEEKQEGRYQIEENPEHINEAVAGNAPAEEAAAEEAPAEEAPAEEPAPEEAPAEGAAEEANEEEENGDGDTEPEEEQTPDEISQQKLEARQEELERKISELEHSETKGDITPEESKILEQLRRNRDSDPVKRKTSRKWWDDLVNSKLNANSCIYELVDNSVGHIFRDIADEPVPLNIDIILTEEPGDPNKATTIEIKDNAKGIQREELDAVLSLWGKTGEHDDENISEHGCGMKYGIRGLGREVVIITKVINEPLALRMTTDDILSMDTIGFRPKLVEVDYEHGTQIIISDLEDQGKNLGKAVSRDMFHNYLLKDLGCRYQFMLSNVFNSMDENGGLRLIRKLENGNPDVPKRVVSLGPIYYCSIENAPQHRLSVVLEDPRGEWKATVTAGEYPDYEDENKEMSPAWKAIQDTKGSDYVSKRRASKKAHDGEPYKRIQGNAGFDIIRRGIVVERGFLAGPEPYRIGDIGTWNNDYNPLIGQIKIERGFNTGTQKTGITRDRHFEELCNLLTKVLTGEDPFTKPDGGTHTHNFLGKTIRGTKPKHKTEEELEAGLVEKLRDKNSLHPSIGTTTFPPFDYSDIFRQVWSGPGRSDILINKGSKNHETVVVEVKKGSAIGKDVYQLLMYMHEHDTKWGILASEGKMDGVDQAMKNISNHHNKKLIRGKPPSMIYFWDFESNPVEVPSDLEKYIKKNDKKDNVDNFRNDRIPEN